MSTTATIGSSKPNKGKLLELTPLEKLVFKLDGTKESSQELGMRNTAAQRITYKLKASNRTRYGIKPSHQGYIQPNSSEKLTITLKEGHDATADNIKQDIFQVQVMEVDPKDTMGIGDTWRDLTGKEIDTLRIRAASEKEEPSTKDALTTSAGQTVRVSTSGSSKQETYVGPHVSLQPGMKIEFGLANPNADESRSVMLKNTTTKIVAFKMQASSVGKYKIKPVHQDTIQPGQKCKLQVVRMAGAKDDDGQVDVLQLQTIQVDNDDKANVANVWKTISKDEIAKHKLYVTGPSTKSSVGSDQKSADMPKTDLNQGPYCAISPSTRLEFAETKEDITRSLFLQNTTKDLVAYKMKASNTERYKMAQAHQGVLSPDQVTRFKITLKAGTGAKTATIKRDQFVLQTMPVNNRNLAEVSELWKSVPKDTIAEHRLRPYIPEPFLDAIPLNEKPSITITQPGKQADSSIKLSEEGGESGGPEAGDHRISRTDSSVVGKSTDADGDSRSATINQKWKGSEADDKPSRSFQTITKRLFQQATLEMPEDNKHEGPLVNISPAEYLLFPAESGSIFGYDPKAVVLMENKTKETVAYKLKSSDVDRYRIKPSYLGTVHPGEIVAVDIFLDKGQQEPALVNADSFGIQSIAIPQDITNDKLRDGFRNTPKNLLNEHKLRAWLGDSPPTEDEKKAVQSKRTLKQVATESQSMKTLKSRMAPSAAEERASALPAGGGKDWKGLLKLKDKAKSMPYSGKHATIHPGFILTFKGKDCMHDLQQTVTITNTTSSYIGYKLRFTSVDSYAVRPNHTGYLEPEIEKDFTLTLRGGFDPKNVSKDDFGVFTMELKKSELHAVANAFRAVATTDIEVHRLRCRAEVENISQRASITTGGHLTIIPSRAIEFRFKQGTESKRVITIKNNMHCAVGYRLLPSSDRLVIKGRERDILMIEQTTKVLIVCTKGFSENTSSDIGSILIESITVQTDMVSKLPALFLTAPPESIQKHRLTCEEKTHSDDDDTLDEITECDLTEDMTDTLNYKALSALSGSPMQRGSLFRKSLAKIAQDVVAQQKGGIPPAAVGNLQKELDEVKARIAIINDIFQNEINEIKLQSTLNNNSILAHQKHLDKVNTLHKALQSSKNELKNSMRDLDDKLKKLQAGEKLQAIKHASDPDAAQEVLQDKPQTAQQATNSSEQLQELEQSIQDLKTNIEDIRSVQSEETYKSGIGLQRDDIKEEMKRLEEKMEIDKEETLTQLGKLDKLDTIEQDLTENKNAIGDMKDIIKEVDTNISEKTNKIQNEIDELGNYINKMKEDMTKNIDNQPQLDTIQEELSKIKNDHVQDINTVKEQQQNTEQRNTEELKLLSDKLDETKENVDNVMNDIPQKLDSLEKQLNDNKELLDKIQQLENDLNSLRHTDLETLKDEVDKQGAQVSSKMEHIEDELNNLKQKEADNLQSLSDDIEKKQANQDDRINQLQEQLDNRKESEEQKQQLQEAMDVKKENTEHQIDDVMEKLNTLQHQNTLQEDNLTALQNKEAEDMKEMQEMMQKLGSSNGENIQELHRAIDTIDTKIVNQLTPIENDVVTLKEYIDKTLPEELSTIKDDVNKIHNIEEKISTMQENMNDINGTTQDMKKDIDTIHVNNATITDDIVSLKEGQESAKSITDELQAANEVSQDKISEMNTKINAIEENLHAQEQGQGDNLNQLHKVEEDLDQLTNSNKTKAEETDNAINELNNRIKNTEDELAQSTERLNKLQEMHHDEISDIKDNDEKIEDLMQKIDECKKKIADTENLSQGMNEHGRRIDECEEVHQKHTNDIETLSETMQQCALKDDVATLNNAVTELRNKQETQDNEIPDSINQLSAEIEKLKNNNDQMKESIKDETSKLAEEFREDLKNQNAIQQRLAENDEEVKSMKQTLDQVSDGQKASNDKQVYAENKLQSVDSEVQNLKEAIEKLQEEHTRDNERNTADLDKIKEDATEAQQSIQKIPQLSDDITELSKFGDEVQEIKKTLDKLINETDETKEELNEAAQVKAAPNVPNNQLDELDSKQAANIEKFTDNIKDLEQQVSSLEKQMDKQKDAIQTDSDKLQELDKSFAGIENNMQDVQSDILKAMETREQVNDLEQKLMEVTNEHDNLSKDVDKLQEALQDTIKTAEETATKNNKEMRSELDGMKDSTNLQMEDIANDIRSIKDNVPGTLNKLEASSTKLENQCNDIQNALDEIKEVTDTNSSKLQNIEEKINDIERNAADVKANVDTFEDKLQALQDTSKLHDDIHQEQEQSMNNLKEMMKTQNGENTELKEKQDLLENKQEEMQQKSDDIQEKLNQLNENIEKQQDDTGVTESKIIALKDDINGSNALIKNIEGKLSENETSHTHNIEMLNQRMDDVEGQLHNDAENLGELSNDTKKEIDRINAAIKKLQTSEELKLEHPDVDKDTYEKNMSDISQDIDTLKTQMAEAFENTKALESELTAVQDNFDQITSSQAGKEDADHEQINTLKNQITANQEQIADLLQQTDALKQQMDGLQGDEMPQVKEGMQSQKDKLQELEDSNAALNSKHDELNAIIQNNQDTITESLQDQIKPLKAFQDSVPLERINDLETSIAELQEENKTSKQQIAAMTDNTAGILQTLNDTSEKIDENNSRLKPVLEKIENNIDEVSDKHQKLKEDSDEVKYSVENLQNAVSTIKQENEKYALLPTKVDDLAKNNENTASRCKEQEEQLQQLNDDMQSLKSISNGIVGNDSSEIPITMSQLNKQMKTLDDNFDEHKRLTDEKFVHLDNDTIPQIENELHGLKAKVSEMAIQPAPVDQEQFTTTIENIEQELNDVRTKVDELIKQTSQDHDKLQSDSVHETQDTNLELNEEMSLKRAQPPPSQLDTGKFDELKDIVDKMQESNQLQSTAVNSEMDKFRASLDNIGDVTKAAKEKAEKAESEIENISKQLANINAIQQDVEELKPEVQNLQNMMENKKQEDDEVNAQIAEHKKTSETLQQELDDMKQVANNLLEELTKLSNKYDNMGTVQSDDINDLHKQLEKVLNKQADDDELLKKLQEDISRYESNQNEKAKDVDAVKAKCSQIMKTLGPQINKANDGYAGLDGKMADAQDIHQKDVEALKSHLSRTDRVMSDLRKQLQTNVSQTDIKAIKDSISKIQQKLDQHNKQPVSETAVQKQRAEEMKELQKGLHELKKQISQQATRPEIDAAQKASPIKTTTKSSTLQKEINELQKNKADSLQFRTDIQRQISLLRHSLGNIKKDLAAKSSKSEGSTPRQDGVIENVIKAVKTTPLESAPKQKGGMNSKSVNSMTKKSDSTNKSSRLQSNKRTESTFGKLKPSSQSTISKQSKMQSNKVSGSAETIPSNSEDSKHPQQGEDIEEPIKAFKAAPLEATPITKPGEGDHSIHSIAKLSDPVLQTENKLDVKTTSLLGMGKQSDPTLEKKRDLQSNQSSEPTVHKQKAFQDTQESEPHEQNIFEQKSNFESNLRRQNSLLDNHQSKLNQLDEQVKEIQEQLEAIPDNTPTITNLKELTQQLQDQVLEHAQALKHSVRPEENKLAMEQIDVIAGKLRKTDEQQAQIEEALAGLLQSDDHKSIEKQLDKLKDDIDQTLEKQRQANNAAIVNALKSFKDKWSQKMKDRVPSDTASHIVPSRETRNTQLLKTLVGTLGLMVMGLVLITWSAIDQAKTLAEQSANGVSKCDFLPALYSGL